jgi:Fe-S-cluster containining protein
MYMGDYIVIDHMIRPFEYACESVSTGTVFTARVDEDKRKIFEDQTFSDQHPAACRFLRPNGDRIQCTIHRDSPSQCKFYRCVVMRVSNEKREVIGTVTGTLSLHSDDPGLRSVWEGVWQKIKESDPDSEAKIQAFLEEHGYHVE